MSINDDLKCPWCGEELDLVGPGIEHAISYVQPSRATTACCGKMVLLDPVVEIAAHKLKAAPGTPDDWGNETT